MSGIGIKNPFRRKTKKGVILTDAPSCFAAISEYDLVHEVVAQVFTEGGGQLLRPGKRTRLWNRNDNTNRNLGTDYDHGIRTLYIYWNGNPMMEAYSFDPPQFEVWVTADPAGGEFTTLILPRSHNSTCFKEMVPCQPDWYPADWLETIEVSGDPTYSDDGKWFTLYG
jgi:hypothetical protein